LLQCSKIAMGKDRACVTLGPLRTARLGKTGDPRYTYGLSPNWLEGEEADARGKRIHDAAPSAVHFSAILRVTHEDLQRQAGRSDARVVCD
jgi:hypothetical protein